VNTKTGYWYQYWPCGNFAQGPDGTTCSVLQNHGAQVIAPVSVYDNTLKYGMYHTKNASSVMFTTMNGGPPNCQGSNQPRFATILFTCSDSGSDTMVIENEPAANLCNKAPGYAFSVPVNVVCPMQENVVFPARTCAYGRPSACIVTSYEAMDSEFGKTLVLKQKDLTCGFLHFSEQSTQTDSCDLTHLVGHRVLEQFDDAVELLEGRTLPAVFYWDAKTQTAVLGEPAELYGQ